MIHQDVLAFRNEIINNTKTTGVELAISTNKKRNRSPSQKSIGSVTVSLPCGSRVHCTINHDGTGIPHVVVDNDTITMDEYREMLLHNNIYCLDFREVDERNAFHFGIFQKSGLLKFVLKLLDLLTALYDTYDANPLVGFTSRELLDELRRRNSPD